jgi:hypothetical protein
MVGRKPAGVLAEQCDFLKSPVETALEIEDRDQQHLDALSNGARWAARSLGKAEPLGAFGSAAAHPGGQRTATGRCRS